MDLTRQVDEHFRDVLQPFAEASDRGVLAVQDGIAVRAVGHAGPAFNTAVVHATRREPLSTLRWAAGLLDGTDRPWSLLLREELRPGLAEALEREGFREVQQLPGMVLDPAHDVPAPASDLLVVTVDQPAELGRHATAIARGFGAPDPTEVVAAFDPRLLADPRVTMLSGYADGAAEPVATAVSVVVGGIGGVFAVTVADAARGRGFGKAITWAAVAAGREAGASWSALQATAIGFPVYAAMGFRTIGTYLRFLRRFLRPRATSVPPGGI